jgi:hypothetical protein
VPKANAAAGEHAHGATSATRALREKGSSSRSVGRGR